MKNDRGRGTDKVKAVRNQLALSEGLHWRPKWTIQKYADYAAFLAGKWHEQVVMDGNCLLNEGINEMFNLICGDPAGVPFSEAIAYIGVGDQATPAADPTQTSLQATTNQLYKAMDTGYPTYGTDQKATWRSTFLAAEANWAWNEITVANGDSDADVNMNRLVQSVGTKASPGVWTVSLEITLA
jgi:hypothetical protein